MRRVLRLALPVVTALVALPLTASPAAAAGSAAGLPRGVQKARVVRIVDGDTIEVRFGKSSRAVRVRLLGLDTPEYGRCWFDSATERARTLLPLGRTAYLLRDRDYKDHYGRRLFYVYNHRGLSVARNLIRYGYAKSLLYRKNDRYIRTMRLEEARARKRRLRIWSGRCDSSKDLVAPLPVEARTAGYAGPGWSPDPRFRTCRSALSAGFGPYERSVHPEYAWYHDADRDGLVCER
ncbi:nuclease [Planomonospora sphaerica]|uniref:Nuclease n=1 Tax=Planomonospora sphaerica TaxID=161355 RepID=A0A171DF96_9ACTN|nr:thermonuclease family protein [Planomonospora sphaerica]GAT68217.1 nuclease [Planomonospora sphaerica]